MEAPSSFPLPQELIRNILEIAARENQGDALRIVLSCRMAQTWIDPLIYGTVSIGGSFKPTSIREFLFTFNAKPSSFFAKHVKGLFLSDPLSLSDAVRIINACPRVQCLALWGLSGPALEVAHLLRLRRLSAPICCTRKAASDSKFRATLAGVTHLDLNDMHLVPKYNLRHIPLEAFPMLTHVAFMTTLESDLARHVRFFLECRSVQCLVILAVGGELGRHRDTLKEEHIDGLRVAVLSIGADEAKNWEAHFKGDADYWTDAGDILHTACQRWRLDGNSSG